MFGVGLTEMAVIAFVAILVFGPERLPDLARQAAQIVKQVRRMVDFYAHESCGQCTPCREGTAWAAKILRRIESGFGTEEDLTTLVEISNNMTGRTICVLSDSCAAPVVSGIKKFRGEFEAYIAGKRKSVAA